MERACNEAALTVQDLSAQRDQAEEKATTAKALEAKLEAEKMRSKRVVEQLSSQLVGQGRAKEASLAKELVRLQEALEMEADPGKKEEMEEKLAKIKRMMSDQDSGGDRDSVLELQEKLQEERELRKKVEKDLAEALDMQLETQNETEQVLLEYEALVQENKALAARVKAEAAEEEAG